jgi:tetratricopeptide (TPR) repeat protein
VDQKTKQSLKQNNFLTTTGGGGLAWSSANRRSVIVTVLALLAVILIAVVIGVVMNSRSNAASAGFGQAMDTYQTRLAVPGQPPFPGEKTFASVEERARAANAQFKAVADKYGSTKDGENSLYFEGVTYAEMGQTASAEAALKQVAGSWNGEMAALGKLALSQVYEGSGRDQQAIDLLNQLSAKPTNSVPAATAQIELAELYTAEGKTDQAKTIYAKLKDKDAKGAAGSIAAEKLNPSASAAPAGGGL